MSQQDLATAAGVTRTTVKNLEGARRFSQLPASLAVIEQALGWAPRSAREVLEGGEPRLLDDSDYGFTRERVSDTVELVSNVIRRVFVAVVPGTPISEVLEAEKLAVELFREEGLLPPANDAR